MEMLIMANICLLRLGASFGLMDIVCDSLGFTTKITYNEKIGSRPPVQVLVSIRVVSVVFPVNGFICVSIKGVCGED